MGIPESSLLGLTEKVGSWIPWGGVALSGSSREVWMPDNGCWMCCMCEINLTECSLHYHCQGCGRVLCGKCVQADGASVVSDGWESATKNGGRIKYCKLCFEANIGHEAGGQYNDKIDHSSTQWSPKQTVSCLSGEINSKMFQSDHLTHSLEAESHGFSPHAVADSSMESSIRHLSPVSFCCSSSRSDEEGGEVSGKPFLSPSSEYSQCVSDIDSSSVSARYEFCSVKSVGSSPLGSPYKMTRTPRAGYSIQQVQMGSPGNQNDASLDQKTMAGLRRPEAESEDLETTNYCSDELSIFQEHYDKVHQPLDFENNGLIWFPPPADDEEDQSENNFFEYDDEDDDIGESGAMFSSISLNSDTSQDREKLNDGPKEPLRAVIHGHFRALVSQLLEGEGISVGNDKGGENWLDIVTSVAWQAANFVKTDTSRGGSMDPGDYVKIKCIVSGTPSESTLIKGVVCTKNIKHKRMTSQYKNPRLLLLGGALEYQRVPNQLASFDTLLQQEIDHLKMVVSKIEVLRPNVLLVEKSVSSYAQEYLLAKEISLVLNVKRPLLERIGRCTGALIVPSIDNLPKARLGYCEIFRLERFSEECTSSSQPNKKLSKTLMFFEGCPKRLGCTVLLRGPCHEELKKVKHVVQYAVFAAYHLSLETSFLADEGASLPKMPLKSSITITERIATDDHAISVFSGSTLPTVCQELTDGPRGTSSHHPTFDVLTQNEGLTGLSTLREFEPVYQHINSGHISVSSPGTIDPVVGMELPDSHIEHSAPFVAKQPCIQLQYDDLTGSSVLPSNIGSHSQHELLEASIQEDMRLRNHRQLEGVCELMKTEGVGLNEVMGEYFSAADNNQSILVSFSSRCVRKGTVCERSQLMRIKFYGNFDKPLGRFLRDDLFDQATFCRACNEPPEAHVLCYTHQQGSLTINVKSIPSLKLPGEREGKIWMWHRCLKCAHKDGVPPATHRVVLSDAAWGLSFGKFLELSFSNHATANRVASCGHSLQRDCLRYYGFGSVVAFFRYAAIDILSVHLPSSVLEFNGHVQQRWVQKEAEELSRKKDSLYAEVFDVLISIEKKSTHVGHIPADMTEFLNRVMELKDCLKKEKDEYDSLLQPFNIEDRHQGQTLVDILEFNRLRRCLVIDSFVWDCQLCSLDSLLRTKNSISKSDCSTLESATYVKLNLRRKELGSDHEENKSGLMEEPNLQALEPASNQLTKVDLSTIMSVKGDHLEGLEMTSAHHHPLQDIQVDGGVSLKNTSLESLPSAASDLSDKIDSAWTGTGQQPVDALFLQASQLDGDHSGSVGLISRRKNPSSRRLMSPVRVYSFDSALRIQDSLRKAQTSSHLSSHRSFDASGDYRSVVRSPVAKMRRTYSHVFPREIKKLNIINPSPFFISSSSVMATEGVRLLLPQTGQNNIVVAVYDEEPTSVISYALSSKDYEEWMAKLDEYEGGWCADESKKEDASNLSGYNHASASIFSVSQSFGFLDSDDIHHQSYGYDDVSSTMGTLFSDPKRTPHAKISFEDESSSTEKAKFSVTCYFAKQFDALRKKCCPSEVDFIRSLSRCRRWSAQGGKSNVYFAKSFDERFIIKQVTKTELDSFERFAPEYFKYLIDSLTSGSPTCLAKVLGIYQVTGKNLKGGRETKMDLMVMENLFFRRSISRVYDLKGSSRSRYNPDTTGKNNVLLDMNLLEALRTKPIFLGSRAKRSLERAVWNDTSFLAAVDVMDYSLLVGVDEERKELVLGIIDFMRQYTWDKHLETWVKASGILGGPKNASPTVISPKQYKKRFRKAMSSYFLTVPDQWSS